MATIQQIKERIATGSNLNEDDLNSIVKLITELEGALDQVRTRSQMLLHQNNGRWNVDKEHEMRALGVTQGNVHLIYNTLHSNEY